MALPRVERARLLYGDWNARVAAGDYFSREKFGVVEAAPSETVGRCRFWDRASSEKRDGNDPDATCGTLMSRDAQGVFYVESVIKLFANPFDVEKAMLNAASQDGVGTIVSFSQDPGSSGAFEAQSTALALCGYDVRYKVATGSKEARARPVSSQSAAGNIKIVRGHWNDEWLRVLQGFPLAKHDDEVDSLSGAFAVLSEPTGCFSNESKIFIPPPDTRLGPRRTFSPRNLRPAVSAANWDNAMEMRYNSKGFQPAPQPPAPVPLSAEENAKLDALAKALAELPGQQ
jgi:predicted phage terminase large subunit-like protein